MRAESRASSIPHSPDCRVRLTGPFHAALIRRSPNRIPAKMRAKVSKTITPTCRTGRTMDASSPTNAEMLRPSQIPGKAETIKETYTAIPRRCGSFATTRASCASAHSGAGVNG